MTRFMVGLTAWAAGTVIAVCVAWLGANVVVRNAGVGPGIPVINAVVPPPTAAPAATPSRSTPPAAVSPAPSAGRPSTGNAAGPGADPAVSAVRPSPSAAAASPDAPASSPAAGAVRAYALAGGTVTLDVTADSVQLVTAVPSAGYSVQTWSEIGWLRVDFSSGPQVSSLIASWYEHAPAITVTN